MPRREPPLVFTIRFGGPTIELQLSPVELDRFYLDAIVASPRERRALVAELLARFASWRVSSLWRGPAADRFRALDLEDQDRVVAGVVESTIRTRAPHHPPPSAAPSPRAPRFSTLIPPTASATRRHGRS